VVAAGGCRSRRWSGGRVAGLPEPKSKVLALQGPLAAMPKAARGSWRCAVEPRLGLELE
jgi:hypothetical protein